MARIKPQALLLQSKKKKGPSRGSRNFIFACNAFVVFLLLAFVVRRRYTSKLNGDSTILEQESHQFSSRKEPPQYAILNTTHGLIYVTLFSDKTPKTVENFVTHSKSGYYNGVQFHRVIKKFMIQGGDPLGDGTGGESIWGGSFEDEFDPSLKHEPFTLSMANRGPNTNGAQFFITTVSTPHLDNKHTVFGRVVKGHDVVKEIENVETNALDKPKSPVIIKNISVVHEI